MTQIVRKNHKLSDSIARNEFSAQTDLYFITTVCKQWTRTQRIKRKDLLTQTTSGLWRKPSAVAMLSSDPVNSRQVGKLYSKQYSNGTVFVKTTGQIVFTTSMFTHIQAIKISTCESKYLTLRDFKLVFEPWETLKSLRNLRRTQSQEQFLLFFQND